MYTRTYIQLHVCTIHLVIHVYSSNSLYFAETHAWYIHVWLQVARPLPMFVLFASVHICLSPGRLLLLAPQLPRHPSAMKQPPQRSLPCGATCCCTVSGTSPGEKHAETELELGHRCESEVLINNAYNKKED